MTKLAEKELSVDEQEVGEQAQEPTQMPGEEIEEKRSMKAHSKQALDTLVQQLELEGWDIVELGKKERFNADGEIITTYTASMKKNTEIVL